MEAHVAPVDAANLAELAQGADASEGLPIRPGLRWTYETQAALTRGAAGLEQSEQVLGVREIEVGARSKQFPDQPYEISDSIRGTVRGESGVRSRSETQTTFVNSGANGLLLYGEEFNNPFRGGVRQLVRHAPPLLLLPAHPTPGSKWRVGSARIDELRLDLEGEVLGFQDAKTPSGLYKSCLKVRITGRFSGYLSMLGVRARVTGGSFSSTEWYALGVGPVLVQEQEKLTLTIAGGQTLTVAETSGRTLRETNATPAALPAAPSSGAR